MITIDETLRPVFATKKNPNPKQVSMFEMTKLITKHLSPVAP